MPGPLHGIRVVELATYVAVPSAATLLADLGADVIKVEVPQGEPMRYSTPRRMGFSGVEFPESAHFQMDNRGKRSLTLDLTRPDALGALLRVVDGADVVLTNMLPGRLRRFGLDPETLRATRPRLIVGSLSGYGNAGEEADRPAFDYAAFWSRTGFMDLMRDEGVAPSWQRGGIGDHPAGLALSCGILAALRQRDATGEGQVVEVSLMHIGFYVLGNDVAPALIAKRSPQRHVREKPRNPLWNHYRTRDDRWLFLVMIESERYWPQLCRALEREELIADPRFEGPVPRFRNNTELVRIFDEVFAARTLLEWESILGRHNLIWSPVRTVAEAIDDPQALAAEMFMTVDHPTAGRFRTVAPPIRMSAHPLAGSRPAPALGADSVDILREAGLEEREIEAALDTSARAGRDDDPGRR
jgi:crotonobetainyl-CoA:carnitine CoA-transferase CaiB-like acyl-CoA transferase